MPFVGRVTNSVKRFLQQLNRCWSIGRLSQKRLRGEAREDRRAEAYLVGTLERDD